MYAVIFNAIINEVDSEYHEMAAQLRDLAINKYGCIEFTAITKGNSEIAISYWQNEEQIAQWRNDTKHLVAQELGREKWYKSYRVQIVKIVREYNKKHNE